MQSRVILKVLGFLLIIFSVTMLPPMFLGWYDNDGTQIVFLEAWGLLLFSGLMMWLPNHKKSDDLRIRDGFLIVVLFWLVLALSGALPFVLAEDPRMSFVDAFFESMSGLTTTGATVLTGLDTLPRSILYYRQQLQWLGGMGPAHHRNSESTVVYLPGTYRSLCSDVLPRWNEPVRRHRA